MYKYYITISETIVLSPEVMIVLFPVILLAFCFIVLNIILWLDDYVPILSL